MYQSKQKQSINYIEIFGKILSIAAIVGLILGGLMAFIYLDNINQLSVFPDVMTDPSSLAAVAAVIGILILGFLSSFIGPYGLLAFWDEIEKNPMMLQFVQTKTTRWWKVKPESTAKQEGLPLLSWLWLWFWILSFMLFAILVFYKVNTWIFLLFELIAFYIPYMWLWRKHILPFGKSWQACLGLGIFIFLFSLLSFCIWYTMTFSMYSWFNQDWVKIIFFIGLYIISVFNTVLSGQYFYLDATRKNKTNYDWLIIISIFSLIMILVVALYSENFTVRILNKIRFVEIPSNASWYLLHNNFPKSDGTQEVIGINRKDLLKLKEKFRNTQMAYDQKKKMYVDFNQSAKRSNALYGYMAWNLGNTKVFCPATVHNYSTVEKEIDSEAFQQCLVIDGKFLQILDTQYIGIDN